MSFLNLASAPAATRAAIADLLASRDLRPVFQPIVDLTRLEIIGYEGLTRGPSDSHLHTPIALFGAAEAVGELAAVERMAAQIIAKAFVVQALPGRLFVNVTPQTLASSSGFRLDVEQTLRQIGLPPSSVVVELTETHAFRNTDELNAAIAELRALGVKVALDDLGEGFAGLLRWNVMRPDFVKIDRHFMEGLAMDPLRQQFIRSIVDISRSAACSVIAEGIESDTDLALLRELGVHAAQGYAIAKPVPSPSTFIRSQVLRALERQTNEPMVSKGPLNRVTAASFVRAGPTITPACTCAEAVAMLQCDRKIYSLPVITDAGEPLGVLRSLNVLTRASGRYFIDLYGKRSCVEVMDRNPLTFDVTTSLKAMSDAVSLIDERHLVDGFMVTKEGRYWGTGRVGDLLRAVADQQLRYARYANPLTQLPGNVPIDEHVDALLAQKQHFVVAHWDIASFKPFNDVYGYRRGDDIIVFTAELLGAHCDTERDFLGHVGGDDFVGVMTSADWHGRIQGALSAFDEGVKTFFDPEHIQAGGYEGINRQGQPTRHALPTLAVGLVQVAPGSHEGHRHIAQAAAEAKRMAKTLPGSQMFLDRRSPAFNPPRDTA